MMEANVSPHDLAALAALRFPDLALSAHLPTDPGAGRSHYRTLLGDLARSCLPDLSAPRRLALERELPVVMAALDKHRFDGPAVAVFSCQPARLLRFWRLLEAEPARLAVAERLDLAPIRRQLAQHPPALAAVVDKQEATLYALTLGEVARVVHLEGTPIHRHEQGGWSASALQRREDEHARANLREVAHEMAGLVDREGYDRLIVAGPQEARAMLKRLLPAPALRLGMVEGAFPTYASGNELAARLRDLDRQS
jgi:hypothetical protein